MLWVIFTLLVILWALGTISNTLTGSYIHFLLLAAVALFIFGMLQRKKKKTEL